jgi:small subunit ribosomal protein S7
VSPQKKSLRARRRKRGDRMDLFGKFSNSVALKDLGITQYLSVKPMIIPQSHGRHAKNRFWRRKVHVVERFANKLMVTGHSKGTKKHVWSGRNNTGKKTKILIAIEKAFDKIAEKSGKNPIQVLVSAVENAAPRVETTSVEYGGVRHPVAVDVSPQRRVDLALKFLAIGSTQKTIKSKKSLSDAIYSELMAAAEGGDAKSFAVDRKDTIERQAEASK